MITRVLFSIFLFATLANLTYAYDAQSPVGNWKTLRDKTNQPSSIVKIFNQNGALTGKIVQLLSGSHFKPGDVCSKCSGSFKNKPIVGLIFLWGFVADKHGGWKNGNVLDPNDGNIYNGTLKLIDNGSKLELRGYWGPFWRTQTWVRA